MILAYWNGCFIFKLVIVTALLVTRNVTSTSIVTEPPIHFEEEEDSNPVNQPVAEAIHATTAPTRKQRQNDEANSPTYDYYYSETTPTYYDYDESDTTSSPAPLATSTTPSPIAAFLLTSTTTLSPVASNVEETTTGIVQSTTDTPR